MKRDAQQTRTRLLTTAYEEMHRHGFQGLRVDSILATTGLKKGAFYHHFDSKRELALAVLDELVADMVRRQWVDPLENHDDPISAIIETIVDAERSIDPDDLFLGCPLNNLAQEMSPIDEGFREHINRLFEAWQQAIASALQHGKTKAAVAEHVDAKRTAAFVVAALEGCIGRVKASRNLDEMKGCATSLIEYLNSLRPSG